VNGTAAHSARHFKGGFSMQRLRLAVVAGSVLLASAAHAQSRVSSSSGALPTGTCQVWINGLPANRQPAPTDCATARATAPANSRIIYGNGSARAGTYGQRSTGTYDPRATGSYDPRYDPRSPQYDPRLDPRNQNGTYDARTARKAEHEREKYERKQQKESEKYERKQQKERDKAWKKGHKGDDGDDDDDDRDEGRYGRGNARNEPVGRATCIDANRDGICDARQIPGRIGRP
jgi:hypothetical protein